MTAEHQIIENLEETYPFQLDYLPDEYREKSERELNETEENITNLLKELKVLAESEFSYIFVSVFIYY